MTKRFGLIFSLLLSLLIFLPLSYGSSFTARPAEPRPIPSTLTIFALDVGQGDSELIVSPTGKIILIDSGVPGNEGTILTAIRKFTGLQCRIDLFIASHPHNDHIGSARAVMGECQVATVLDSNFPATTAVYQHYLEAVKESGAKYIQAAPDQTFDIGGSAKLTVLAPIQPFFTQAQIHAGATTPNANSVVVRLDYNKFSMLFTGDAEAETEARMIANHANLKARVLKVGHHGSRYATSEEFLGVVKPEAATISDGADNNYGHPSPETLKRLKDAGVKVYRTDLQGQIGITTDGDNYHVTTERTTTESAIFTGRRPPKGGQ